MADTNNTNNEETSRARGWLVLKHHMLTHKVGWLAVLCWADINVQCIVTR